MLAEKYSIFTPNNKKNFFENNIRREIVEATKKITKKLSKKIVCLSILTKNYEQEKQTYEWRLKTQFPIIKVRSYDLQQYNPNKSLSFLTKKVSVTVQIENFPATLSQLSQIPMFKILYLLKQSLIGLQRLVSRFGFFIVNPEMIVINNQSKCNIWFNSNLAANQIQIQSTTQKQLLQSLFSAVQASSANSKQVKQFFEYIKSYKTILETLSAIQSFAKINKTKIPTQFILKLQKQQFKCPSNHLKSQYEQSSPKKGQNMFFSPNTSLKKVPKFIENIRSTINYPGGKHFNSTQLKRQQLIDIKNNILSDSKQSSSKMTKSQKRIPSFIAMKSSSKNSERTAKFGNSNQNSYPFSNNEQQYIAKLIDIEQCQAQSYRESMMMIDLSIHGSMEIKHSKVKIPIFQTNDSFLKELDKSSFIINEQRKSRANLIKDEISKILQSTLGDTGKIVPKWQQKITTLFQNQQFDKSFHEQDQEQQNFQ